MAILSKLLGQRIKELRKRNGLTQAALAELIGMETTNLCKLEMVVNFQKKKILKNS